MDIIEVINCKLCDIVINADFVALTHGFSTLCELFREIKDDPAQEHRVEDLETVVDFLLELIRVVHEQA